eukprot:scaffold938_cov334-Pavlova_lutheri.AAC.84
MPPLWRGWVPPFPERRSSSAHGKWRGRPIECVVARRRPGVSRTVEESMEKSTPRLPPGRDRGWCDVHGLMQYNSHRLQMAYDHLDVSTQDQGHRCQSPSVGDLALMYVHREEAFIANGYMAHPPGKDTGGKTNQSQAILYYSPSR